MAIKIHTSDKIYISKSKISGAGKGVFAKKDIKKEYVIEKCIFLKITKNDPAFDSPKLVQYLFFFGKNKENAALALGCGSLYNHSENPNAIYKINPNEKIIEVKALKNIKKDMEITFDYLRGKVNIKHPLWFKTS